MEEEFQLKTESPDFASGFFIATQEVFLLPVFGNTSLKDFRKEEKWKT